MQHIFLEVPVETLDDAIAAEKGGANRLELGSALEVGGLTPSLGALKTIRQTVSLPIIALVRPRSGGCDYGDRDFRVMLADRDILLENGIDGLVFGFLDKNGCIEKNRLIEFLRGIPSNVETVFHRAFDLVENAAEALEILIDHGVKRVLTSGLQPTAIEGAEQIKAIVEQANHRIEIIGGGGIRLENIAEVIHRTGLQQIHASCRAQAQDRSARLRPEIKFGLSELPPETIHRRTDASLVTCLRAAMA